MECSLYIHIPFCTRKCGYCDFYSISGASAYDIDRYLRRLRAEIKRQLDDYKVYAVPTVYIGGGTPSYLGASRLDALFSFLAKTLPSAPQEFTIEANTESLDADFVRACGEGGVTRLSVGVQTFHQEGRTAIGRTGSASGARKALDMFAAQAGDIELSLDMMTGLPFQNEAALASDIQTALSYHPAHLSLYDLLLEEGTALAQNVQSGAVSLPDRDEAASLWIAGRNLLEQAGYIQYEVSNFSLCGKRSAHNLRYWRMQNWLGCGKSASGTVIDDGRGDGVRLTDGKEEYLDRATLLKETLLMGFRCVDGPDEALFEKRFGLPLSRAIPVTLKRWREKDWADRNKIALNKSGLLFLNRFLAGCFAELEAAGRGHPVTGKPRGRSFDN